MCDQPFERVGRQIFCKNTCKLKFYWKTIYSGSSKEKARSKAKYKRLGKTDVWRFNYYKAHAQKAKRDFSISLEEFTGLIHSPCFYCGDAEVQMGVDRIDNNLGYTQDNVRSACPRCNIAKGKMTEGEFYEMCEKVNNKHTCQ